MYKRLFTFLTLIGCLFGMLCGDMVTELYIVFVTNMTGTMRLLVVIQLVQGEELFVAVRAEIFWIL